MNGSIPDPDKDFSTVRIEEDYAQIKQDTEEAELTPYKISFSSYTRKKCGIDGMTEDNSVFLLKILRDIGLHYTDEKNFKENVTGNPEVKFVHDNGDYSEVFNACPVDSEVWEIKKVHEAHNVDVRLFYYTISSERVFYIVHIQGDVHFDTSKSKKPEKPEKKKKDFREWHRKGRGRW